jgi:hypothetical protein
LNDEEEGRVGVGLKDEVVRVHFGLEDQEEVRVQHRLQDEEKERSPWLGGWS